MLFGTNLAQFNESIESFSSAVNHNDVEFKYHYNLGLAYLKVSEGPFYKSFPL